MTEPLVTYRVDEDIALLGLNRQEKRNALSSELQDQLESLALRAQSEAKAAVLFSHSEHFCAGLDLKEAAGWLSDHQRHLEKRVGTADKARPFDYLSRGRIPFVAAISGACIGGGLEIASSCHVRVADETSFFALPEGQRGIYIGGGGSVRIARLLGVSRMTDMMLTGRVLSAAEGERYGLVQYLVPKGNQFDHAVSLARRIAGNAPLTNWAIVHGLPRIQDYSYDDGLFIEGLFSHIAASTEATTRIADFVEGRAERLNVPVDSRGQD